jgi:hypothetical protein
MKPVDYRNETFASLKTRLADLRLEAYDALKVHGPCTTEALARAMRPNDPLFVLTVRPRVTELCQLGFAVLEEEDHGMHETHENKTNPPSVSSVHSVVAPPRSSGGRYRACSEFEARALFDAARRDACREQLLMKV